MNQDAKLPTSAAPPEAAYPQQESQPAAQVAAPPAPGAGAPALAQTAPTTSATAPTLDGLREELTTLQKQFKQALWAGSIAIAGLSALGIAKLGDIETKAREKIDSAVNKGSEYFDAIVNGQARANAGNWAGAITYLEQAMALRPDDEFVFYQLASAYASGAEIEAGLKLLNEAERNGLLLRRYSSVWSQLNVARIYMLASIADSKHKPQAEVYFDKAERAASRSKGGEMAYVLYSRGIFELLNRNEAKAKSVLRSLADIDPRTQKWPEADRPEPWFQLVLRVRPKLQEELEALMTGQ
jgi:predicted Zn-dependent protease